MIQTPVIFTGESMVYVAQGWPIAALFSHTDRQEAPLQRMHNVHQQPKHTYCIWDASYLLRDEAPPKQMMMKSTSWNAREAHSVIMRCKWTFSSLLRRQMSGWAPLHVHQWVQMKMHTAIELKWIPISMICATEVILCNVCDYMLLGIYVLLLVVGISKCMEDGRNYLTNIVLRL